MCLFFFSLPLFFALVARFVLFLFLFLFSLNILVIVLCFFLVVAWQPPRQWKQENCFWSFVCYISAHTFFMYDQQINVDVYRHNFHSHHKKEKEKKIQFRKPNGVQTPNTGLPSTCLFLFFFTKATVVYFC